MRRSKSEYQPDVGDLPVDPMTPPATRAEFERNLFLLRERYRQSRIHLLPTIKTRGLQRVRILPNGRIDLLSVDESVRLQANMMAHMEGSMSTLPSESVNDKENGAS